MQPLFDATSHRSDIEHPHLQCVWTTQLKAWQHLIISVPRSSLLQAHGKSLLTQTSSVKERLVPHRFHLWFLASVGLRFRGPDLVCIISFSETPCVNSPGLQQGQGLGSGLVWSSNWAAIQPDDPRGFGLWRCSWRFWSYSDFLQHVGRGAGGDHGVLHWQVHLGLHLWHAAGKSSGFH